MANDLSESPSKRGPGRPKAEEPKVPVTTWVKRSEYDKLCRLSMKHDTKLSTLVRQILVLRLP